MNQINLTILTNETKMNFFQNYNKFKLSLNISNIFSVFCGVNISKVILILSCLLFGSIFGQDVQYSQFYATNMAINPAFTGATRFARVTLAQRSQWLNSPGKVVSYLAGYDRFFYYQKLGLGGLLQYDRLASGTINNLQIGPTASYVVYNEKDRSLRLGLGLSFVHKRYSMPAYVFADQLDPDFGLIASQSQDQGRLPSASKSYLDANAGFLYTSKAFWVGAAAHHMNRPKEALGQGDYKTPIKLGLHTGYKIEFVDQKGLASKEERYLTLALNAKHQGTATQLDLGTYVVLEPITFGVWYRGLPMIKSKEGYVNQDAIVGIFGFDSQGFRVAYSYDVTISKLGLKTGGAHELSLIWQFGDVSDAKKKKPGRMKTMYMPFPKI